jgi:hypothetical protein
MQEAFMEEVTRVEDLVVRARMMKASQRRDDAGATTGAQPPEPSFLVTARASFDLSVAADRDKQLALLVERAVDVAGTILAVLAQQDAHLIDLCRNALQTVRGCPTSCLRLMLQTSEHGVDDDDVRVQVIDRTGRPEGLAGRMVKRREPVVRSLLAHVPVLMHRLQQRHQQLQLSPSPTRRARAEPDNVILNTTQ